MTDRPTAEPGPTHVLQLILLDSKPLAEHTPGRRLQFALDRPDLLAPSREVDGVEELLEEHQARAVAVALGVDRG